MLSPVTHLCTHRYDHTYVEQSILKMPEEQSDENFACLTYDKKEDLIKFINRKRYKPIVEEYLKYINEFKLQAKNWLGDDNYLLYTGKIEIFEKKIQNIEKLILKDVSILLSEIKYKFSLVTFKLKQLPYLEKTKNLISIELTDFLDDIDKCTDGILARLENILIALNRLKENLRFTLHDSKLQLLKNYTYSFLLYRKEKFPLTELNDIHDYNHVSDSVADVLQIKKHHDRYGTLTKAALKEEDLLHFRADIASNVNASSIIYYLVTKYKDELNNILQSKSEKLDFTVTSDNLSPDKLEQISTLIIDDLKVKLKNENIDFYTFFEPNEDYTSYTCSHFCIKVAKLIHNSLVEEDKQIKPSRYMTKAEIASGKWLDYPNIEYEEGLYFNPYHFDEKGSLCEYILLSTVDYDIVSLSDLFFYLQIKGRINNLTIKSLTKLETLSELESKVGEKKLDRIIFQSLRLTTEIEEIDIEISKHDFFMYLCNKNKSEQLILSGILQGKKDLFLRKDFQLLTSIITEKYYSGYSFEKELLWVKHSPLFEMFIIEELKNEHDITNLVNNYEYFVLQNFSCHVIKKIYNPSEIDNLFEVKINNFNINDFVIYKKLFQLGGNINIQNAKGINLLMYLSSNNLKDKLKQILLINNKHINFNIKFPSTGRTAAFLAAFYGHAEVLDMLIREDITQLTQVDKFGMSLLMVAIKNKNLNCIKVIMSENNKGKLDYSLTDYNNQSLKDYLKECDNQEIIHMLNEFL